MTLFLFTGWLPVGVDSLFERRSEPRGRPLLDGKIAFKDGRSAINCVVWDLSANGACVQVQSKVDFSGDVLLTIPGDKKPRASTVTWHAANRIGLTFHQRYSVESNVCTQPLAARPAPQFMRSEMFALRAALDEVEFGVVLLDCELRAQFINRAYRIMFHLSDETADNKPAFIALMQHGRDSGSQRIPPGNLDEYVARRIALVSDGNPIPVDLPMSDGEVIRLRCTVLPNGGRMLTYTYVTDIVRQSDELHVLRASLDAAEEGVVFLDADLTVQIMNRAARNLMKVTDEQAESRPDYSTLVAQSRQTHTFDVDPEELDTLIARRIELARVGDPAPHDLRMADGRHIRSRCNILPSGGRMLTYWDVTDLIRHAEELEKLASLDAMTGLYNRRHLLSLANAEWIRFQRYQRPLSMLMVDVDHFKSINDQYGHGIGDDALSFVAGACLEGKRDADIVGRLGGEEFALLLPETNLRQAAVVAERIRRKVEAHSVTGPRGYFTMTVSIGIAPATINMSGITALMHAADQALYRAKALGRNRIAQFEPAPTDARPLVAE